jgi:hypothetical protein
VWTEGGEGKRERKTGLHRIRERRGGDAEEVVCGERMREEIEKEGRRRRERERRWWTENSMDRKGEIAR